MSFSAGQTLLDSSGRRMLNASGKTALDGCIDVYTGDCVGTIDSRRRVNVIRGDATIGSLTIDNIDFGSAGGTSSYDFSVTDVAISAISPPDVEMESSWHSFSVPGATSGSISLYYKITVEFSDYTSPSGQPYLSQSWDKCTWTVTVSFSTTASFTGYITSYLGEVNDSVTSLTSDSVSFSGLDGSIVAAFVRCWCSLNRGSANRWMLLPEPGNYEPPGSYPSLATYGFKAYPFDTVVQVSTSTLVRADDSSDTELIGTWDTKSQELISGTYYNTHDTWITNSLMSTAETSIANLWNINQSPDDPSDLAGLITAEFGDIAGNPGILVVLRDPDGDTLASIGFRDNRNYFGYWNAEGTMFTPPTSFSHSLSHTVDGGGYVGDYAGYTNNRSGAATDEQTLKSATATISIVDSGADIPTATLPEAYDVVLKDETGVTVWTGTLVRPLIATGGVESADRRDVYWLYSGGTLTGSISMTMSLGLDEVPNHLSRPVGAWVLTGITESSSLAGSMSTIYICPGSGTNPLPISGRVIPIHSKWTVELTPSTAPGGV